MKLLPLNFYFAALLISSFNCLYSQSSVEKKSKFYFTAGYGLGGSFSVRQYEETTPFPSAPSRYFSKKNFVGTALDGAIGMRLGKRYELRAGLNYQRYNRWIESQDTISNVVISVETTIGERDYMYFSSLNRLYGKNKHNFSTGLGIYYVKYRSQHIRYGYGRPNFFTMHEPKSANNDELGFLADLAYEYKFQPKVNLGVRAQLYFTASIGSFESITLFPFIRINF